MRKIISFSANTHALFNDLPLYIWTELLDSFIRDARFVRSKCTNNNTETFLQFLAIVRNRNASISTFCMAPRSFDIMNAKIADINKICIDFDGVTQMLANEHEEIH